MNKTALRVLGMMVLTTAAAMARVTSPSPVPEPGTLVLMGVGLAGMALYARKRMKK